MLFNSSSASGQKRNLLYRQLFARMGLYEPCGRVNQGFALQEAVVTDAQAQEMVGLLTKMEASLASRVSSIGDERMPSTQVFSRVEGLATRITAFVGDLERLVITKRDASLFQLALDNILSELRKHTLVLESINTKVHDIFNKPPAPTKRRRS